MLTTHRPGLDSVILSVVVPEDFTVRIEDVDADALISVSVNLFLMRWP